MTDVAATLTDVTPNPIPAAIAAQATATGRRLKVGRAITPSGHVLLPYGDYGSNTGPIDVIGWRPSDGNVTTFLQDVPDERIENYRVLNGGAIWSCNTDPSLRLECQLATNAGGTWHLVESSVPGKGVAVHLFDVAQLSNGHLLTCGARNFTDDEQENTPGANPDPEYNTALFVWLSTDGGDSWVEDFVDLKVNDGFYRPYGFGKIGNNLYVSPSDGSGHWRRGIGGTWGPKVTPAAGVVADLQIASPPVWGDESFAVGSTRYTRVGGLLQAETFGPHYDHGPRGYLFVDDEGTLTYGDRVYGHLSAPGSYSGVIGSDGETVYLSNGAAIFAVSPLPAEPARPQSPAGDTILLPMLDALRVSLEEALATTMAGPPCRVTLQDGPAPTADWCSCGGGGGCGMGWVRLASLYPSSAAFPAADTKPGSCASILAATIEVGAYRCAPMPDGKGTPPPPHVQTQAALEVADDAMAMACAFRLCDAVTSRPNVLGRYTPLNGGDCHGGALQATIQLVPRDTRPRADPRRRPTG